MGMAETVETFVDPFTLAYDALYDLIEANPRWSELVKPGNRMKLNRGPAPVPKGMRRALADLTESVLIPSPSGQTVKLKATSSTSFATVLYNLRIKTDEPKLAKLVFPLKYAFLAAMAKAPDDLGLRGVVAGWDVTDASDEALGSEAAYYGSQGWASVYTVAVAFQLNTAELGWGDPR